MKSGVHENAPTDPRRSAAGIVHDARAISTVLDCVRSACVVCRFVQTRLDALRAMTKDDASPVTIADFASQAVVARALLRAGLLDAPGRGGRTLVGEESAEFLKEPAHAGHLRACIAALRDSGVWPDCTTDELIGAVDLGAGEPEPLSAEVGGWTLDPVDGTKGFLRNQQYCVSLGLIVSGEPVLGVLGCPNLSADPAFPLEQSDPVGSMFICARGGGAWAASLGGLDSVLAHATPPGSARTPAFQAPAGFARVHCSQSTSCSGSPAAVFRCAESVDAAHVSHSASARVMARAAEIGGWRVGEPVRMDSQCKYALVARGQADVYLRVPSKKGYIEKIWDHAAGTLLASEAGCFVTDGYGRALDFSRGRLLDRNQGIVAAPASLHAAIIRAIGELAPSPSAPPTSALPTPGPN